MTAKCHIRIFVPGGGWITATATADPLRVVAALEGCRAVVSYSREGVEYEEETDVYAHLREVTR